MSLQLYLNSQGRKVLEPRDRAPIFPMDCDSLMMKSFPAKWAEGVASHPDGGIKVFFTVGRSCHLSSLHCLSIVKVNGIFPVI